MSHRGKEFIVIAEEAETDLRELLAVPPNYKVLFLQGGGDGQFAMVPMNLLRGKKSADYVETGQWSKKAIKEGEEILRGEYCGKCRRRELHLRPRAREVEARSAGGLRAHTPRTKPSAASNITGCRTRAWRAARRGYVIAYPVATDGRGRYGLIYAGAQKNSVRRVSRS